MTKYDISQVSYFEDQVFQAIDCMV